MKLQDFISKTMAAIEAGSGSNIWQTVRFDVAIDAKNEVVEVANTANAAPSMTRLTFDIFNPKEMKAEN